MIYQILLVSISIITILLVLFLRLTRKIYIILLTTEIIQQYSLYFLILLILHTLQFNLSFIIFLKKEPSKFIKKISKSIQKYNIFYKSYGIVLDFFGPQYTQYLIKFAKWVLKLKPNTVNGIIVFFVIFPQFMIVSVFFLEIHFRQLHYYFYSLILLLIPLIFRIILFILMDVGPRLEPQLKELLVVEFYPLPEDPVINGLVGRKMRPDLLDIDINHFLDNYYYPLLKITPFMTEILPTYLRISSITSLLYHFCHIIGLFYILFII